MYGPLLLQQLRVGLLQTLNTARDLLGYVDHPATDPLTDGWCRGMLDNLRAVVDQALAAVRVGAGALTAAGADPERVRGWLEAVGRDGGDLADRLRDNPAASTTRALYDNLSAAVRELEHVRQQLDLLPLMPPMPSPDAPARPEDDQ
jgi:hypothetical protein